MDFFPCLLFGMNFFWHSRLPDWELKLRPYLQYNVSAYTKFLKCRTRKLNFHSCKPCIDKQVFIFPRLVVLRPIYQPFVPSILYQFGRLIGYPCHNSRIKRADLPAIHVKYTSFFGPIYRPIAVKGLIACRFSISFYFKRRNYEVVKVWICTLSSVRSLSALSDYRAPRNDCGVYNTLVQNQLFRDRRHGSTASLCTRSSRPRKSLRHIKVTMRLKSFLSYMICFPSKNLNFVSFLNETKN